MRVVEAGGHRATTKATILDHFAELDHPRVERARRRQLVDILAIAIRATICGADSWAHIEPFGRSKQAWFQSFLELPHGIPTHDTLGDIFARLDPMQLQICFSAWATLLKNEKTLKVGIQGKRLNAGRDEDYLLKVLLG